MCKNETHNCNPWQYRCKFTTYNLYSQLTSGNIKLTSVLLQISSGNLQITNVYLQLTSGNLQLTSGNL